MSICISFFTGKKTVYFFICVCVCVCGECPALRCIGENLTECPTICFLPGQLKVFT